MRLTNRSFFALSVVMAIKKGLLFYRKRKVCYDENKIKKYGREVLFMKEVFTNKAPAAIGPYSQAVIAGDFLYASGSIGINPETGEVVDGVEKQTIQVMENLRAVLLEADATFSQVAKFTIYLNDMEDFALVNEIYGRYLKKPYPARATVEVSRLPKDVLVEIDAVVYLKG